jgi:(1->4)-alpha-D-glucan 1-alpha-D-glucosylmutase
MGKDPEERSETMVRRRQVDPVYVPSSTYRLQFNRCFTFDQAAELIEYLDALGVSACYASPFLRARPGSLHGYDVTDHSQINPEIGTPEQFRQFAQKLKQHGMGLIVDVVSNHMCITDASNQWWWDVLENGPSSTYARFFDVDWHPPKEELANKVLLPFLGEQFGRVLEAQEIKLLYEDGAFYFALQDMRLPVAPRSWHLVLEAARKELEQRLEAADPDLLELESILTALSYLPPRTETDEAKIRERQREKEIIKRRLLTLTEKNDAIRRAVATIVQQMNGTPNDPRSLDDLERLLDDQPYRLAFWRVAADEINYRRFFDINELAAIRVEDPEVYEAVHRLIFGLIREGYVTGLRVDHPDGLFEPEHYFQDLQKSCLAAVGGAGSSFFVVAEKILVGDERLRSRWAIEGTTGYGFLNYLNGLFVDATKRRAFQRLYERLTDWSQSHEDLIYESKKLILQVSLSSELNVLARKLDRISEQHRWSRDFTLENLRDALREVVACFPIYRTYIDTDALRPDGEDERHIRLAIECAKRRNPALSESVFEFIQNVLLLQEPEGLNEAQRAERRLFVMRLQQFTGPVMAKGLEDTAFYRYCPLASLNEVGASLGQFGVSPALFHSKNLIRQSGWRNALLATATHDTKRGEDVRARINVLSEIPAEWYHKVRVWQRLNRSKKTEVSRVETPSSSEEYLLYQTLLGTWPFGPMQPGQQQEYIGRIHGYMEKALREAKQHTSWVSPNAAYEEAVHKFIDALLTLEIPNPFLTDFLPFQARIARAGMWSSLSQVLLKIASPGIPDFYQGSELWDFRLADPDNRRPVDFASRRTSLERLRQANCAPAVLVRHLISEPQDGAIKLYVINRGLSFRKDNRDLFAKGGYVPLRSAGERQRHVVAFARTLGGHSVIAAVGRYFIALGGDQRVPAGEEAWSGTTLILPKRFTSRSYHDVLTQQAVVPEGRNGKLTLSLAQVFSQLPLALLVSS